MYKDERDLLDVLKAELAYLEEGGYDRSPSESWKQPLIFEDSPICMNYDAMDHVEPCSSCVLFQLVPPQFRGKEIPCRHIPFNAEGETLDSLWLNSLYRHSRQFEIEEVFGHWLRTTVATLEKERQAECAVVDRSSALSGVGSIGEPLFQKLPKCANPACTTEFRWLAGGKFFRFRAEPAPSHSKDEGAPSPLASHGVKHYWLCEHCSNALTLAFEKNQVVVSNHRTEFLYHGE